MSDEIKALVERLRKGCSCSKCRLDLCECDTMDEAAAALTAQAEEIERLNAEVERWARAYRIAHDQAMANGSALSRARAALKAAQEVKP